MNSVCQFGPNEYQLFRFPKGQHDKSLQAWDGGDIYLAEHVLEHFAPSTTTLIMNDNFGAISTFLHEYPLTVSTDSYISHRAVEQNITLNSLTMPTIQHSLHTLPESDLVIIKLSKNLGYIEYQLQQISQLAAPCHIIAVGKTTLVTSNLLKLFERYLSNVTTSLAKKKSRLIFASHSNSNINDKGKTFPVSVTWPEKELTLKAHANVFSKDQIDIGGRFLADNLVHVTNGQSVIDLGCGNGLLGLSLLQQTKHTEFSLSFIDESYMAIESAKLNVSEQFPNQMAHCQFIQDDCLTEQAANSADIILCNPPFHQQNTITEHIAKQMFKQAHRVLKNGGHLYVVANRHLPYGNNLKKRFGGITIHAQNKKFVIYKCVKQ